MNSCNSVSLTECIQSIYKIFRLVREHLFQYLSVVRNELLMCTLVFCKDDVIFKLNQFGLSDNVDNWIQDFLTDRTIQVRVGS